MKKEWYAGEIRQVFKRAKKIGLTGLSEFPPVIITCAITGGLHGKEKNPNLPLSMEEQVKATYDAYNAGASIVHIHTRNPKNLSQMSDDVETYKEINRRIREKCPEIIINNTFVGARSYWPNKATEPPMRISAEARPELASLDLIKGLFGERVFAQTFSDATENLKILEKYGCKPELGIFDPGDFKILHQLVDHHLVQAPYWIQCVFNDLGAYSLLEYLGIYEKIIPEDSLLSVLGVGPAQTPICALSLLMGHHVRVGLEDNVYYHRGELAKSNAQLVERIVRIAHDLGRPIASPKEARTMMGLGSPREYN
ncbi:MAG: 3-keto-5-aminohexanoate cleavage protein [Tissierellia bacterium]|nr:3-keto-5-aminohexanoate cleavage protein [Tissierellia bacterium]